MGQNTSTRLYSPKFRLDAALHGQEALKNVFPVTLGPNLTIAKGNLLVPGSATATTDVQTITFTGSPTGGTFTLVGTNPVTGVPFTTGAITYAASGTGDTNIQNGLNAALTASGGGSVTVSSLGITFAGLAASQPVVPLTLGTNGLTGGSSPALTIAHTTPGVIAGTHTLYAGSGTPNCWLQYDVVTDANGLVQGGEWGQRTPYAQAYFAGDFYGADLPNLDSAAVTAMKARFLTGSLGVAGAIISIH